MKGNETIKISKHAIEQFRSRILNNPLAEEERIRILIKQIFTNANYISDNKKGILFRNRDLNIELIIKDKTIVTIYPINGGRNVNYIKNAG